MNYKSYLKDEAVKELHDMAEGFISALTDIATCNCPIEQLRSMSDLLGLLGENLPLPNSLTEAAAHACEVTAYDLQCDLSELSKFRQRKSD